MEAYPPKCFYNLDEPSLSYFLDIFHRLDCCFYFPQSLSVVLKFFSMSLWGLLSFLKYIHNQPEWSLQIMLENIRGDWRNFFFMMDHTKGLDQGFSISMESSSPPPGGNFRLGGGGLRRERRRGIWN